MSDDDTQSEFSPTDAIPLISSCLYLVWKKESKDFDVPTVLRLLWQHHYAPPIPRPFYCLKISLRMRITTRGFHVTTITIVTPILLPPIKADKVHLDFSPTVIDQREKELSCQRQEFSFSLACVEADRRHPSRDLCYAIVALSFIVPQPLNLCIPPRPFLWA